MKDTSGTEKTIKKKPERTARAAGQAETKKKSRAAKKDKTAETKSRSSTNFTKEQLLKSDRYRHQRDILAVLLNSEKAYSLTEVDRLLHKFMKGKVN